MMPGIKGRHRRRMTRHLVEMLKEEGELGKVLETEPGSSTGGRIQSLISDVANEMAGESRGANEGVGEAAEAKGDAVSGMHQIVEQDTRKDKAVVCSATPCHCGGRKAGYVVTYRNGSKELASKKCAQMHLVAGIRCRPLKKGREIP